MAQTYQKEWTPVLYGDSAVKVLSMQFTPSRNCFSMHWHDRMELLYIYAGDMVINCGNADMHVSAGNVAIFPPARPHRGVSGPNGVRYNVIMFDVASFYNTAGASKELLLPIVERAVDFVAVTDAPAVVSCAKAIVTTATQHTPCGTLSLIGQIYTLLGELYAHCQLACPSQIIADRRISAVLSYIDRHFCEDISTATISAQFGYTEAYFCRLFKTVTGLTPMRYLQILRLEKAQKLLQDGHSTITAAAMKCAFTDISYFSKCFKKHFGMTPTAFMAQNT